jgi:hypothetical protein
MTAQVIAAVCLAAAGALAAAVAVVHERRMHRHRLPGVSYWAATWRRDGGWRRADLFTPQGLAHQRVAARFGALATTFWLLALIAWVMLAG